MDRAFRTNWTGYDAVGRVVAVTNTVFTLEVAIQRTGYDSLGRVAWTVDSRGTTNAVGYDVLGRRTSVTNAWGTDVEQVTCFAYGDAGNQTAMTNAAMQVTEYQYDLRNRRYLTLSPPTLVGGPKGSSVVTYDLADRRTSEQNEVGILTGFGYDGLGRLTSVTSALGDPVDQAITRYAYDEAGNQTNQVDALLHTTTMVPDAMGRRIQRILPGSQKTGYGYDAVGNLQTLTNADTVVITHEYDDFNRLKRRLQGNTQLETYDYAASGRLTNRMDSSGTHAWIYDARDRIKLNLTPAGALSYTYDSNGNLLTLCSATSNGVTNQYTYDALNRLTNVLDLRLSGTFKNTGYNFDPVGNLKTVNFAAVNQVGIHLYNARQQLTNVAWTRAGSSLANFEYILAAHGLRTNLVENFGGGPSRAYAWQLDSRNRLKQEVLTGPAPSGSATYSLDAVGNRLNRTSNLPNRPPTQPTTFNNNDWPNAESYDSKGNLQISGVNSLGYDWVNRLTSVNGGGTLYTYDADGNRVSKVGGGVTTWYLVATVNPTGYPQVVEERTGATPTTLNLAYTYGLDLISQRSGSGSTVYFFTTDGLGSTRLLTDQNGATANTFSYDAFGTLIGSTFAAQTTYLYTGEQYDPTLGMYYLRARYLRPDVGRFATLDTFEGVQTDPLSLHKYLYTQDNPVNMVDPSGREYTLPGVLTTTFNVVNLASKAYVSYNIGHLIGTGLRFTYDEEMELDELLDESLKTGVDIAGGWAVGRGVGFAFNRWIGPLARKLLPSP